LVSSIYTTEILISLDAIYSYIIVLVVVGIVIIIEVIVVKEVFIVLYTNKIINSPLSQLQKFTSPK
jgi:hypothetical protein